MVNLIGSKQTGLKNENLETHLKKDFNDYRKRDIYHGTWSELGDFSVLRLKQRYEQIRFLNFINSLDQLALFIYMGAYAH